MATGFFTDATLCIGCKACEVACKQWNELPSDGYEFTGNSYDNTSQLSGTTWRHVDFIERESVDESGVTASWSMLSDVCKHCTNAGCLEACPTGAIVRNEFGSVFVQPDVCNGCGYCVVSCPFGVIDLIEAVGHGDDAAKYGLATLHDDRLNERKTAVQATGGVAGKCTLCFDRQRVGMVPACAKACPTESIQFGEIEELRERAKARVETLQQRGVEAQLYGADDVGGGIGPLNAFFLLTDSPEAYNLPVEPVLPSTRQAMGYAAAAAAALTLATIGWAIFRGDA
ncbi:MAG: 4Fe-4S dicluster domain-containing protein [Candidatus Eremiobacteraeota bacterium]|nr:4Fe-4S dicluster domain-containing protein [Candidatus Eremiobacteraeota bacterium]NNM91704.1 4Fe-4S dicluster domain-containing protein [Candidatus Eremiobacteraeota bacterium]